MLLDLASFSLVSSVLSLELLDVVWVVRSLGPAFLLSASIDQFLMD